MFPVIFSFSVAIIPIIALNVESLSISKGPDTWRPVPIYAAHQIIKRQASLSGNTASTNAGIAVQGLDASFVNSSFSTGGANNSNTFTGGISSGVSNAPGVGNVSAGVTSSPNSSPSSHTVSVTHPVAFAGSSSTTNAPNIDINPNVPHGHKNSSKSNLLFTAVSANNATALPGSFGTLNAHGITINSIIPAGGGRNNSTHSSIGNSNKPDALVGGISSDPTNAPRVEVNPIADPVSMGSTNSNSTPNAVIGNNPNLFAGNTTSHISEVTVNPNKLNGSVSSTNSKLPSVSTNFGSSNSPGIAINPNSPTGTKNTSNSNSPPNMGVSNNPNVQSSGFGVVSISNQPVNVVISSNFNRPAAGMTATNFVTSISHNAHPGRITVSHSHLVAWPSISTFQGALPIVRPITTGFVPKLRCWPNRLWRNPYWRGWGVLGNRWGNRLSGWY